MYQRFGTIKRTVLVELPWWPVDFQALPPRGWCAKCGSEVYRKGQVRCRRCSLMDNGQLTADNEGVRVAHGFE